MNPTRHATYLKVLLAGIGLLLLAVTGAQAADPTWGGGTNLDWCYATNWVGGYYPTNGATLKADINSGICLITDYDTNGAAIPGGQVGTNIVTGDFKPGCTSGQTGTVTQTGGSLTVQGYNYVGFTAGATGIENFNGGVCTNLAHLHVGTYTTGYLNINGGTFYCGAGTTTVGGGFGTAVAGGNGVVNLTNGTLYNVGANPFIVGANSNANYGVASAGAHSGTLNLVGGTFHAAGLYDTNAYALEIGGATINSIGYANFSGGTLTAVNMYVGYDANSIGFMTITNTAVVNVGTTLIGGVGLNPNSIFDIGYGAGSVASLNVSGGTLTTEAFLGAVGGNSEGDINQSGARLLSSRPAPMTGSWAPPRVVCAFTT